MRDKSIGSTAIDVVAAIGIVVTMVVIAIAVAGPGRAFAQRRDELRVDGVRNIMEAMIELQTVAPQHIDRLRAAVEATGAPPRVMIGSGETCAGDWGAQCGDALLADGCVDLGVFLGDYLSQMPVDPESLYSAAATGYYVTFAPGVLEVGACNPENQEVIRLERTFF